MLTELLHMHVYDEKCLITSRMHTAHMPIFRLLGEASEVSPCRNNTLHRWQLNLACRTWPCGQNLAGWEHRLQNWKFYGIS